MRPPSEALKKKPYQVPKLLVYGDLTEMTKTAGIRMNPDGGIPVSMRRTGK